MLSSFFKKLSGRKASSKTTDNESVDLSRAIPGYVSPFGEAEAETPTETPDVLTETPITQDEGEPEVRDQSEVLVLDQNLSPEEKAEAALEALSDKHSDWANNDIENLRAAWANIRGHEDLGGQLDDLNLVAHNLKGMAATYGHPAIARIASSLCTLLESDHANTQHALINLHVEACRAAQLHAEGSGASDQIAQSVCVALEAQVKRTVTG